MRAILNYLWLSSIDVFFRYRLTFSTILFYNYFCILQNSAIGTMAYCAPPVEMSPGNDPADQRRELLNFLKIPAQQETSVLGPAFSPPSQSQPSYSLPKLRQTYFGHSTGPMPEEKMTIEEMRSQIIANADVIFTESKRSIVVVLSRVREFGQNNPACKENTERPHEYQAILHDKVSRNALLRGGFQAGPIDAFRALLDATAEKIGYLFNFRTNALDHQDEQQSDASTDDTAVNKATLRKSPSLDSLESNSPTEGEAAQRPYDRSDAWRYGKMYVTEKDYRYHDTKKPWTWRSFSFGIFGL